MRARQEPAWWWWALPCWLVWGICLLGFWPGIMDAENAALWQAAASHSSGDTATAVMILYYRAVQQIVATPALAVLIHIILGGLLVGWVMQGSAAAGRSLNGPGTDYRHHCTAYTHRPVHVRAFAACAGPAGPAGPGRIPAAKHCLQGRVDQPVWLDCPWPLCPDPGVVDTTV